MQASRDTVPVAEFIERQPLSQHTNGIRKVIYLVQPTNEQEFYDEMVLNKPELADIIIGRPRMFSPTVAMVMFSPSATIPTKVFVFGARQRVVEYKEKAKKEGKTRRGRGSHVQTPEPDPIAAERRNNIPASTSGGAHSNRGRRGRGRGGS